METGGETYRLRQEIERALRRAFDPADVFPRLARLARLAPPASDDGVFAHRQLAELLVERHPWRAAIHARRALAHRHDDDRAWAILAFCQTLLGNFRCAATAYKKAVAFAPSNPWYAHNLGHLLDVALGEPERALTWLRTAYGSKSDNSEIVASYVHALARAGRMAQARSVLEQALQRFDSRELEALLLWVEQGAPSRPSRHASRHAPTSTSDAAHDGNGSDGSPSPLKGAPARRRARKSVPRDRRLARLLEQGLSHLPLDKKQRERALVLARDVLEEHDPRPDHDPTHPTHPTPQGESATQAPSREHESRPGRKARGHAAPKAKSEHASPDRVGRLSVVHEHEPRRSARSTSTRARATAGVDAASTTTGKPRAEDVASLAAAVAYAIVYVDHVPLSQAEVAAPFRVAVGRLRGRFAELRAKLDLIRGDARYATTRH